MWAKIDNPPVKKEEIFFYYIKTKRQKFFIFEIRNKTEHAVHSYAAGKG